MIREATRLCQPFNGIQRVLLSGGQVPSGTSVRNGQVPPRAVLGGSLRIGDELPAGQLAAGAEPHDDQPDRVQLRGLEVDVRGVRETGRSKDGPRSGCYRAEVERLAGGGDA